MAMLPDIIAWFKDTPNKSVGEIRNDQLPQTTSEIRKARGIYGATRRGQHVRTSLASGDQAAGELRIVEYLAWYAKLVCLPISS